MTDMKKAGPKPGPDAATLENKAFKEAGGPYDKTVAKRYHDLIQSVGNSVAPDIAFRNFRGRDVDTEALMRERGFAT